MKKTIITLIICLLILIILVGTLIVKLNKEENNIANKNEVTNNITEGNKDNSIEFYKKKSTDSRSFGNDNKNTKYKIQNDEELEMFRTLYKDFTLAKRYDLTSNTIFIETKTYGSGSIEVNFKDVIIDEDIKFNVDTDIPEIGTDDMAYWYLISIIPNEKLDGVNTEEWKSPINVNNNL